MFHQFFLLEGTEEMGYLVHRHNRLPQDARHGGRCWLCVDAPGIKRVSSVSYVDTGSYALDHELDLTGAPSSPGGLAYIFTKNWEEKT